MLKGKEMNLNKIFGRIGKNNCKKIKVESNTKRKYSHALKT